MGAILSTPVADLLSVATNRVRLLEQGASPIQFDAAVARLNTLACGRMFRPLRANGTVLPLAPISSLQILQKIEIDGSRSVVTVTIFANEPELGSCLIASGNGFGPVTEAAEKVLLGLPLQADVQPLDET